MPPHHRLKAKAEIKLFAIALLLPSSCGGPDMLDDNEVLGDRHTCDCDLHELLADIEPLQAWSAAGSSTTTLPPRVNNAQEAYFRPIFEQSGGSCVHAASIGYIFTYEINRARNLPANIPENQYPTHFTYHFSQSPWSIVEKLGVPNVEAFGGMSSSELMSGYDKYHAAMKNRIERQWRIDVATADDLPVLKGWLYNYNSDSAAGPGGLVRFSANMNGLDVDYAAEVPADSPLELMITTWGTSGGHAMTFVGYDDGVRYDFNKDGQYTNDLDITNDGEVTLRDWEIGALIVANSHGVWMSSGFVYMPYRLLVIAIEDGGTAIIDEITKMGIIHTRAQESPTNRHEPQLTARVQWFHEKLTATSFRFEFVDGAIDTLRPLGSLTTGDDGPTELADRNGDPVEMGFDLTAATADGRTPTEVVLVFREEDPENRYAGQILAVEILQNVSGSLVTVGEWAGGVVLVENDTETKMRVPINMHPSTDDGCDVAGLARCLIDGACIEQGESRPDNPCQACLPATSTDAWSNNDTASCDDGIADTVDSCVQGVCVGERPDEGCTPSNDCDDGLPCTVDRCDATSDECAHSVDDASCLIGNACFGDQDLNPDNTCQVCSPGRSRSAWTDLDGDTCGGSGQAEEEPGGPNDDGVGAVDGSGQSQQDPLERVQGFSTCAAAGASVPLWSMWLVWLFLCRLRNS